MGRGCFTRESQRSNRIQTQEDGIRAPWGQATAGVRRQAGEWGGAGWSRVWPGPEGSGAGLWGAGTQASCSTWDPKSLADHFCVEPQSGHQGGLGDVTTFVCQQGQLPGEALLPSSDQAQSEVPNPEVMGARKAGFEVQGPHLGASEGLAPWISAYSPPKR